LGALALGLAGGVGLATLMKRRSRHRQRASPEEIKRAIERGSVSKLDEANARALAKARARNRRTYQRSRSRRRSTNKRRRYR